MEFVWPILPPPRSTKGQLFGANHGKHTGLDMGTGGDVVRATAAGTVVAATTVPDSRGRLVIINHGADEDGVKWETRHYHLASKTVSRGDSVAAGDQIGVAGRAGLPWNHPHLHYEVRRNGIAIDPQTVLPPRDAEGVAGFGGFGLAPYALEPGWFGGLADDSAVNETTEAETIGPAPDLDSLVDPEDSQAWTIEEAVEEEFAAGSSWDWLVPVGLVGATLYLFYKTLNPSPRRVQRRA